MKVYVLHWVKLDGLNNDITFGDATVFRDEILASIRQMELLKSLGAKDETEIGVFHEQEHCLIKVFNTDDGDYIETKLEHYII